jgi:hypothetical protein
MSDLRFDDEIDVIVEQLEQRFEQKTEVRAEPPQGPRSAHQIAGTGANRFLPLLAEQRARKELHGRRAR